MVKKVKKTGIAFGGGGTRGIAHLGAIRVFQENHIDFDFVTGNSAGSIAGAVYAAGIKWEDLYEFVLNLREKNVVPKTPPLLSYMSPDVIENLADSFLKDMQFEDLGKPFHAVAVDLERGTLDTLSSGNVSRALAASCAVPGIFQPVQIGDKTYIDGGTLCSIPTEELRHMGADTVVGINLNADLSRGTKSLRRVDVILTAYNLSVNVNSLLCEQFADLMLRPDLEKHPPYSLKSIEVVLKIGEDTARESLDAITALLSGKTPE